MSSPVWSDPIEGQGTAHNFEIEPELIGTFLRTETLDVRDNFGGGYREATIHRLRKQDGTAVDTWGSTDLDSKLRNVEHGSLIRILFTGSDEITTNAGESRTIKRFTVQVDESTVPTPAPEPASAHDDIPF